MRRKRVFDGSHQEKALRALLVREADGLKTRSGKTLTAVAEEVGLSYGHFWRYVAGELPLRSDQFGTFAEALETDKASLLRACFPSLATSREPTLRERLVAGDVPEDEVREVLSETLGKELSPAAQARIAQIVIEDVEQRPGDREQPIPHRATS
jgi:hypothetical protein